MSSEVPAVNAAIRILERLAADLPRPVSPTELVNDLGLNRSTCYNILATLQRAGWVDKLEAPGGWTLGPGLLALTGVSDDAAVAVIEEEITGLSRELNLVVFAARQNESDGYTVVAVSDPRRGIRVIVGVGDRFPFAAPALMQAFYAHRPFAEFLDAARTRQLDKFTDGTVVDTDVLAELFAEIRDRGYSTSIKQFNLAQSAAAAPVFDRAGRARFAIGVLAFSSELDHRSIQPVGDQIAVTAGRITARTGGTLPSADHGAPAVTSMS
jgi:IclR family acetate operon transcriptional repressor